jgi:uracil permease
LGTLLFLLVTKGEVPAYLGSSFAFIAPIIAVSTQFGVGSAMFGALLAGLLYVVIAFLVYFFGVDWLNRLLPPVVIGSVIIVIGLGLAATSVGMAMNIPGSDPAQYSLPHFLVALATLAIAVIATIFFRGFLGVIPILVGIIGGYIIALLAGLVDLTPVAEAKWFAVPDFTLPVPASASAGWAAALMIVPVALVTVTEHIGHLMVTGSVMNRDLVKDPGLHRTLLGDGLATSLASVFGGPPNTTYGENIGVLAITRVFSTWVIGLAAVIAILLAFIGKLGALIGTIPPNVMGGVTILLFGIIASAGLRMLVDSGIDFGDKRNLVIASVTLVVGVGGAVLAFGQFKIESMALATIVGILLNLVLPEKRDISEGQSN